MRPRSALKSILPLPLVLLLTLLFSACAPTLPLYLEVYRQPLPATKGSAVGANLLITPFSTDKVAEAAIGELFSWQGTQEIRVDGRALRDGITTKIEALLQKQGLSIRTVQGWDGTLAGMQGIGDGRQILLGGKIRQLKINSTKKTMRTVSTLQLVVDCYIGLPAKNTLVTRTVEVKLERTHLLQDSKELEILLNEGLKDAAVRLVAEINGVLNSALSK